ncbi:MAG: MBL fold metallo-hydrolase [Actinobacteria bacterium]|nr:MBL fold metallo-hydrolase [Actinomycetota bacterium]
MPDVAPLDLLHGAERVIGVYLLETDEGPALFDCGPTSCLPTLEQRLEERGLVLTELRHLLLSHIHLDHAGAAGALVREHPGLQVHVSGIGAPHLVDPSRLERSARRLYGDAFDTLWGELAPVPQENVRIVGDRAAGLDCFATPGHASHHVSYLDAEGTLFAGDALGVRIQPSRHIMPVSPPPDVDLEAWARTLDEVEQRAPERLAPIHFGTIDDPREHIPRLREALARWAGRVRDGVSEDEFVRTARAELERDEGGHSAYEHAAPLWQSYAGLRRYWDKRAEAEAGLSDSPSSPSR